MNVGHTQNILSNELSGIWNPTLSLLQKLIFSQQAIEHSK